MTLAHRGKEGFEFEGRQLEAELSLFHLNPLCQQFVVFGDGLNEFPNVAERLFVRFSVAHHLSHFVEDSVEEGHDTVYEAELGALLHIQPLVALNALFCSLLQFLQLFLFFGEVGIDLFILAE